MVATESRQVNVDHFNLF